MTQEINNWATAAASNNLAPPDGAPESGTKLGQVNNIIRECMAVVARWFKDGNLVSTGTGSAFALTLNRSLPAYYDGLRFVWRNHTGNAAGAFLSLNGLAYKAIRNNRLLAINAGHLDGKWLDTIYSQGLDVFVVQNITPEVSVPVGSILPFIAVTAPVGWIRYLPGWHDRLLRIVEDNSGATAAGTWTISGLSSETANHTHSYSTTTGAPSAAVPAPQGAGQGLAPQGHTHGLSGVTSGVSNAHTHQGDASWRPPYGNVILCQRS